MLDISQKYFNINNLPSTVKVPILDSKKSNNVLGAEGLAFPSSSSSSGLTRPRPFPFPGNIADKSFTSGQIKQNSFYSTCFLLFFKLENNT